MLIFLFCEQEINLKHSVIKLIRGRTLLPAESFHSGVLLRPQLGLGVLPLNINNFTEHRYQTRSLHDHDKVVKR